jgi:uncharacterized protein YxjI
VSKYCGACGNPVSAEARFCGKCGASLPDIVESHISEKTQGLMPLFDGRRNYYLIKRKWWGWGAGTIHDERGAVIGHLYRRVLTIRDTTEFREIDNITLSVIIHRKILAIRDTMEIKDGQDRLLARVRQKILTLFRPVVWLENPHGKKILEAKGNFLGFNFYVYDMKGNRVAEIDKAYKWRDIFAGGSIFDFENLYGLIIHDPKIDRRLILPLVIAIDEVVHEDRKGRR